MKFSKVISFAAASTLLLSPAISFAQDVSVNVNANLKATEAQVKSDVKVGVKSTSTVSTEAREIRGWSETEKKDFLSGVKAQAQLKSGQDLDNFAKGVMLKDDAVSLVASDEAGVEVKYKLPAKFLGIFSTDITTITNVSFETNKQGRGPKEVTVKFPWYRMFFSLSEEAREDVLETAITKSVELNAQTPRDNHYAQNGITINLISSILKGIRAEISASTTASTN